MTSGMGQDVGAVLEGKLPEIARLVEQEFEKEKRRGGMMYQTRAQIGDFMPCVRIYLFADSLQPFESDRLSAENMGGRWSDIHVGGWYGNFYLEAFSHLEQDRDSLLACLEKRICPSFSCLAHYMGADAIVIPCWVYYGPEDPEATPMEFGWVSPTGRGLCLLGFCDYWVDGEMHFWHGDPPSRQVVEKYTERTVLCLREQYREWILKDGVIYTGVHVDSSGNVVLEGSQEYLDRLSVYPSFARYFNRFDNSRCIPKEIRPLLVQCLELIQEPVHLPKKRDFKHVQYMGRYVAMDFPDIWTHYHQDNPDVDTGFQVPRPAEPQDTF